MVNNYLKKVAAILFLTLLLFNWFGYKLVLTYLQQKADLRLEARIDIDDYDESQLIEIRVPLQLPYSNDWAKFERCYGNIEIDGKYYTYVKMKIEDGYAVLKCILNAQKEVIQKAENRIIKASQGIMDHENETASSVFVKVIKCYIGDFDDQKYTSYLGLMKSFHKEHHASRPAFLQRGFDNTSEQPPDHMLFL